MIQKLLASEHRVCAVCDEIVLNRQEVCNFEVSELPTSFFSRLQPPSGNNPLIPKLDGLLRKQYDVSELFADERFEDILLSPRAFSSEIRAAGDPQVPICKRCERKNLQSWLLQMDFTWEPCQSTCKTCQERM